LKNDGTLGWTCPHCGRENSAHISHEDVRHVSEQMVALPACACGTVTCPVVSHPPEAQVESIETMQLHRQLAEHLHAIGKGYVERGAPEPMVPLSQIEETVMKLLNERRK